MDSVTHIVIGACVGVVAARKLPVRTAMFWGALFQTLPDFDFIASFWSTPAEQLLTHRGFTHSILFALLITPLLAWLAQRYSTRDRISYRHWMFFAGLQLLIHMLIDVLNVYGVGWLEPFSHHRFAINWIFVADPFFTIIPLLVFLVLLIAGKRINATRWATVAVFAALLYLGYCGYNKWQTDRAARSIIQEQGIAMKDYFTTPAPFNNWVWYIAARTDSGFYTGYRSVFDAPGKLQLQFRPQHRDILSSYFERKDLHDLLRFANGYYVVTMKNDSLLFCDIRFGEQMGWEKPQAPFVFYYYMQYPDNNSLLVQRGRSAGWNKRTLQRYFDRILGYQFITPAGNKK